MMTAPIAIRARGLRKAYKVYQHPADAFIEAVLRKPRHLERVALESVDLELLRGEIVGILGRNGAGKSTLLKIIAGTLERTSGELDVNGRITAILELGTGFHPDYTGRENIYMGGLCLGMTRREIDAKIDSIIDFSELRDVIDQSFKTYSTGMQARLTFSTAISVEPDILIVDEALSVGDARFQLKCFSRLQALRDKKTTILLVSHDTNTITSMCDRALILEGGTVFAEGNPKTVSVLYQNMLFGKRDSDGIALTVLSESPDDEGMSAATPLSPSPIDAGSQSKDRLEKKDSETAASQGSETTLRYGSGEAQLTDWGMFDSNANPISVIESGSEFRLSMTLNCRMDINDISCGFAVKDRRGTVVWGITNVTHSQSAIRAVAGQRLVINVPGFMWLAAGDYFVTLGAAHLDDGSKIDFIEDAIGFRVLGPGDIFTTSLVNMQARFEVEADLA